MNLTEVDGIYVEEGELVLRRHDADSSGAWRTTVYNGALVRYWEDYTVETWFMDSRQHNTADTQGIIARWQGSIPAFESDGEGYVAQHQGESDGPGSIQIVRDLVRAGSDNDVLGSEPLSASLESGQWYRLKFTLEGPDLTAEIFREDGTRLGSVAVSDTTYDSGSAGLRARMTFHGRETYFSGLAVTGETPEIPGDSRSPVLG